MSRSYIASGLSTYSCLKDTKEETGDHDVGEVLGPDHDENKDTPEKG